MHLKEWDIVSKKRRNIIYQVIICCLLTIMTGCNVNKNNDCNASPTMYGRTENNVELQTEEDKQTISAETVTAEREETEDSLFSDNQESEITLENVGYPYYCLEVNDPIVQEIIADGWEDGFQSRVFIKGLVGYTPKCDVFGNLDGYIKDREIIIEKNVGKGILQSEQLPEVKENILIMIMDIIRNKGGNVADYQEYFADEAILQQMETYLRTEIEEDWLLLETFYLSDYAGNEEHITWFCKNETTWQDEENEITYRLSETDSSYCFALFFYADYRTMGYEPEDKAAAIAFNCAVSKETGLIDEISISRWYITRYDFETSRW